ncbi:MAG TPA: NUDIX domain-containing protein [Candidatus Paceibacterota bacterium]|nr:NUDIX domain-containing protein [Candidatus Paceibacterota bacterium]
MNQLPISTVVYLLRDGSGSTEVFLGRKAPKPKAVKRGIAYLRIGYGGDLEAGKDLSPAHCASRELGEESDFTGRPEDMKAVAQIKIIDEAGPRLMLHYFLLRKWSGEPGESDEILDGKWYPLGSLPDDIIPSDTHILPRVLQGEKLIGWMEYATDPDGKLRLVRFELSPVESLS